jgi:leukotriene-A4 hydrolase
LGFTPRPSGATLAGMKAFLAAPVLLSCLACADPAGPATVPLGRTPVVDEHSFAEPERVRVTHMKLDLELDFEARQVRGRVILELERPDPTAPLVLDTQALEIQSVEGWNTGPREWDLAPPVGRLGRKLTVQLEEGDKEIRVIYRTTSAGEALQFLEPEMTGGEHPYLFTQGQAILTRSWIPCQDSPGVRVTYDANIIAPKPLTVLMSADIRSGHRELVLDHGLDDQREVWGFEMTQPIPSYLIALACGEVEQRAISERCSVFASPAQIEAAAAEFADVEKMVSTAEQLFGDYRWGRYDILILPPAFPYGGMENPTLTFMTPTALAGDRSLVAIVAHELAHSWSGNLVTNATWRDFWLNEGFTVYVERRIMEALYGPQRARMEALLDYESLQAELGELLAYQTVLHVDLTGRHPDDGFSGVPYNKGSLLLHRVEQIVGRKRLDAWLRTWFDGHAFQSVTTADLRSSLGKLVLGTELDLEDWIEGVGLPQDAPRPESDALAQVEAQVARLEQGTPATELATEGWVTQQWLHFIKRLPPGLSGPAMAELDTAFGFTASGNAEIACAWMVRAIEAGYPAVDGRLESFLMEVGRRKFLAPLYGALCATEAGRARARVIYAKARPRYHPVSAISLDKIVNGED